MTGPALPDDLLPQGRTATAVHDRAGSASGRPHLSNSSKVAGFTLLVASLIAPGFALASTRAAVPGTPGVQSVPIQLNGPGFSATLTAGQIQQYSFSGLAGQQVSVKVSGGSFGGLCNLTFTAVDATGTTLTDPVCGGYASASAPVVTLPASGTFAVELDAVTGGSLWLSANSTGPTSITPNATSSVQVTVAPNTSWSGYVPATAGSFLIPSISRQTPQVDCALTTQVFGPDGAGLSDSMCTGNVTTLANRANVAINGDQEVRVTNSGTVPVGFAVNVTIGSDTAFTLRPGVVQPVVLDAVGETTTLYLGGDQTVRPTLALDSNALPDGTTLALVRPDGTTALVRPVSSTDTAIVLPPLDLPGTWSAVLAPQQATGSVGVSLQQVPIGAATLSGNSASVVSVPVAGSATIVSFAGTAGMRPNFVWSGLTMTDGVDLTLEDSSGNAIAARTLFAGSGQIAFDALLTSGTYRLVVAPVNGASGNFTLGVQQAPDVIGPLTLNSARVVTLALPSQRARLSFSGNAGQSVAVSYALSTLSAGVFNLLDASGNAVGTSLPIATGKSWRDLPSLPASGNYFLELVPDGTIGSIAVTLKLLDPVRVSLVAGSNGSASAIAKIATAGQQVVASFNGVAGSKIAWSLLNNTIKQANLTLRAPDGTLLSDGFPLVGTVTGDPAVLPVTGIYTILVDPLDQSIGTMTIQIAPAP